MNPGYLYALLAILIWGSYSVPFKKSPASNILQFQAVMGLGILLFSVLVSLVLHYSFNTNPYGLAAGILWGLGNVAGLFAIRSIGMSRAMPIWVSFVILVSFLWGILFFHELPSGLLLGLIGIVGIIIGVSFIGSTGNARSGRLSECFTR